MTEFYLFGLPILVVVGVIYLHCIWRQSKIQNQQLSRILQLTEFRVVRDGLLPSTYSSLAIISEPPHETGDLPKAHE